MVRRGKIGALFACGRLLVILLLASVACCAAESGTGRVVTLTGQVSIDRGRDLWAIQISDLIEPGAVIVTGPNSYALLQLDDGSRVEVFADSRVVFRANRGNWRDLLDLFLGRVRIHIEKIGGRPNPYRVNSATALIAVRGTTFDVLVQPDDTTTISVEEGIVAVTHKLLPSSREVLVQPGETLTVHPGEALAREGVSKTRIAGRVLGTALDEVLRTMRIGSIGRTGSPAPVPGGTPGSGAGGDMGQPPTPGGTPGGGNIPGDDSGGGTPPPVTGGGGTTAPPPRQTAPPRPATGRPH